MRPIAVRRNPRTRTQRPEPMIKFHPAPGFLCALLLLPAQPLNAQVLDRAPLVTFGPAAGADEGDDDFSQTFYIEVPADTAGPLYIRVYDPDTGGVLDERLEDWNTAVRYRLIGDAFDPQPQLPTGAMVGFEDPTRPDGSDGSDAEDPPKTAPEAPAAQTPPEAAAEDAVETVAEGEPEPPQAEAPTAETPAPADSPAPSAPRTLADQTFEKDRLVDGQWINLAEVSPEDGLAQGEKRLFLLQVNGVSGNDGNVFDLAVSTEPRRNSPPPGSRIYTYVPTVHVPRGEGRFAEARFSVPLGMQHLRIHNFDLEKASVRVQTPFRTLNKVASSGGGMWIADRIELLPDEQGVDNAVSLATFPNKVNDATFFVTDDQGAPLPLTLPFRFFRDNHRPQPALDTTVLNDCRTLVLDGSATQDADNDDLSFHWRIDGEELTGNPLSHRFASAGEYPVEMIVTDDSGVVGDSARLNRRIRLNRPPEAVFPAPPPAMPGQNVEFDASASVDPDGKILDYHWSFGDGAEATGPQTDHLYTRPGYYRVRLRVRDDADSPCSVVTAEQEVWINSPPVLEAGPDRRAAVRETLTLTPQQVYDSDGEPEIFVWTLGDGELASGREVEHAYLAPGRYEVGLTIDDGSGAFNSRTRDSFTVWVNAPPQADPGPEQRVAAQQELTLDASASADSDGKILHYRWDLGDGQTAQGRQITHRYAEPGEYTVTLEVEDDSGVGNATASAQTQVRVNFPPVPEAGADQRVTASEVRFDGSASADPDGEILNYHWDFGDGHSAEGPNPVHLYGNPGRYPVVLRVTDDSGTPSASASDQLEVVVNAAPVADPGPVLTGAPGEQLKFDASRSFDPDGEIVSYQWFFGDRTSAAGQSLTHSYFRPNRYQARLRVTDDSGDELAVDEAALEVRINAAPVAVFEAPRRTAPGQDAILDASRSYDPDGQPLTFLWRLSDGAKSASPRLVHRFEQPGIYYADLYLDDASGVANGLVHQQAAIQVNHPPRAVPGEDIQTCASNIRFDARQSQDADGDTLSYQWDFGDGGTAAGPVAEHSYAAGGVYPVILTVDDGLGLDNSRDSASLVVRINQPPLAHAGADRTVCAGDAVVFNGAGSADPEDALLKHQWQVGERIRLDGVSPAQVFKSGGVYPVELTVDDGSGLECGISRDQMVLRVAESPVARAGDDMRACANSEIRFDGSASVDADGLVNAYVWDFGDGAQGGGPTPAHLYTEPGEYQVRLTITGDQVGVCDNTDSDTLQVQVNSAPTAALTAPSVAAIGESVSFDAAASDGRGAPIQAWRWDFGDGAQAEGERVSHRFEEPGRHRVTLEVVTDENAKCGRTTSQHLLVVNQPPQARSDAPRTGLTREPLVFDGGASTDADGAITEYVWDFGDGRQASGVQVRHRYATPGDYPVSLLVVDDSGAANDRAQTEFQVQIQDPARPVITGPEQLCTGETARFELAPTSAAEIEWQTGDATGAGAQWDHRFDAPGRHWVQARIADPAGDPRLVAHELRVSAPPTLQADFPAVACAGEPLSFFAGRSRHHGDAARYLWDFGDGANAEGPAAEHTYAEPGAYDVVFKLNDGLDLACSEATTKRILRINHPPQADAGPDRQVWVGGAHDRTLFDAGGSRDRDGDRLHFRWDFGDGASAGGQRVFHRYQAPGEYRVRLSVDDGATGDCSLSEDEILIQAEARP